MKHPRRLSLLFFIGVFMAGSTALGYYYYFVYEPPLAAAESFMRAMERHDAAALKRLVIVTPDPEPTRLRAPKETEIADLLKNPFHRGRILDQHKRTGATREFDYLVYREPDGSIYALLVTQVGKDYRVVIPERHSNPKTPYLWDYNWTTQ